MIGINSDLPSFFIEDSGGEGKTGKIGIGNVTTPTAKLHIKADANEDASVLLEPTGNYYGKIMIGSSSHYIQAKSGSNMHFETERNQDFVFENGNVGIGTNPPTEKLDVNGNIKQRARFHIETEKIQSNSRAGLKLYTNFGTGITIDERGQVGINKPNPSAALDVDGKIKTTDFQFDNSDPHMSNISAGDVLCSVDTYGNADWISQTSIDDGDWTIDNENNIYRIGGKIGIGTSNIDTDAKLEVVGKIVASNFKLTSNNHGAGKLLQSDAYGNATWVNPPETDDGDWEINGNDIYRSYGKVGIGTTSPNALLHIKTNTGNQTEDFLIVENPGVLGSGSTIIGKVLSGGPVIIQQAGDTHFNNQGSSLSFFQKTSEDSTGFGITTYTNTLGGVRWVDMYSPHSTTYLRAQKSLVFESGGQDPIRFITQGSENKENGQQRMEINTDGQVGIGTTIHQSESLLTVAGRIHAKEVKVTANAGGADFVFDDDYNLPDIDDVNNYIKTHKHLPDIPSADEMVNNGIDVGEMQIKLLQKIEELTLYVIDLKKENEEMRADNEKVKAEIEGLKRR